jgi:multidrug resistance efflux pump
MFEPAMDKVRAAQREVERLRALVEIVQARCANAEAEVLRYRYMTPAQFAEQQERKEQERLRHAETVGSWYDRRGGVIGGGV